jgi:hypothetical protein
MDREDARKLSPEAQHERRRQVVRAYKRGVSRRQIARGVEEIERKPEMETGRVRKPGGGRKPKRVADATLLDDLKHLVEPATRGDPMRTLRWTSKSLRHLFIPHPLLRVALWKTATHY